MTPEEIELVKHLQSTGRWAVYPRKWNDYFCMGLVIAFFLAGAVYIFLERQHLRDMERMHDRVLNEIESKGMVKWKH